MDEAKMKDGLINIVSKGNWLLNEIDRGEVNNTPRSLHQTLVTLIELSKNVEVLSDEVVSQYNKGWYHEDIAQLLRDNGWNVP